MIIPAYDAERWIARSIESVLHQTVPATEILVIDDGSVDGTARAAQAYGPAVGHIFQQNGGVSVALNRGTQESTQEWIGALAAGLLRRTGFETQVWAFDPTRAPRPLRWFGPLRRAGYLLAPAFRAAGAVHIVGATASPNQVGE